MSAFMFCLIVLVMVEAVRSWIRYWNIPQDYRDEEEVEEETLAVLQEKGQVAE